MRPDEIKNPNLNLYIFTEQKKHIRLLKQTKRKINDWKKHLVSVNTMLMAHHWILTEKQKKTKQKLWLWHRKNMRKWNMKEPLVPSLKFSLSPFSVLVSIPMQFFSWKNYVRIPLKVFDFSIIHISFHLKIKKNGQKRLKFHHFPL